MASYRVSLRSDTASFYEVVNRFDELNRPGNDAAGYFDDGGRICTWFDARGGAFVGAQFRAECCCRVEGVFVSFGGDLHGQKCFAVDCLDG